MRIKIIILFSLLSMGVFSQPYIYYVADTSVNASASDSNTGLDSTTNAWATWQKAFNTAEAGDTVYFRGGVWYPTEWVIYNPDASKGNLGTYGNEIVL